MFRGVLGPLLSEMRFYEPYTRVEDQEKEGRGRAIREHQDLEWSLLREWVDSMHGSDMSWIEVAVISLSFW